MKRINLIKTISAAGIVGITGIMLSTTLTSCSKNTYTINEGSMSLTIDVGTYTTDVTWISSSHTIKIHAEPSSKCCLSFLVNQEANPTYELGLFKGVFYYALKQGEINLIHLKNIWIYSMILIL